MEFGFIIGLFIYLGELILVDLDRSKYLLDFDVLSSIRVVWSAQGILLGTLGKLGFWGCDLRYVALGFVEWEIWAFKREKRGNLEDYVKNKNYQP